jgi:hypothetical protein
LKEEKRKMKKKIFFAIIFILFTLFIYGSVPAQEREALIALYHSTNGDNWFNNSGWKTPPLHSDGFAMPGTEGTWYGITVTNDHVTHVGMMYNNLIGNMPPELGNLSQLEYLVLADNYTLSGSIPKELGKLSNLLLFQASVNQLTGSIPPEMGNLKKLKGFNLYANYLSGSIPPELGNLTNLESMMMGWNLLSGGIPAEFGKLTNLEWLDFYANRLDGHIPPELGNLTRLKYLGLYWNRLIGKIPNTLVNLQSADIKISYNALYTHSASLCAFLDSKEPGWENTQTIAPSDVTVTPLSQTSARISWTPITYTWDTGGYRIFYRLSSKDSWTYSGMTADKLTSSYQVRGLSPGACYCFKVQTRTNPNIENPNTVDSEFSSPVCTVVGSIGPFGSFDTPEHGAIARGSIPVTGWALDDFGVISVKIYREKSTESGEKTNGALVFIGDADFVENARPDVEEAFPGYPNNHAAGWGYMMLTNFLPNHGNGTFKIHAVATDVEGNQTTLGIKTIICDNAHAVKPFGTIDTPTQGGTASGKEFVNFGWALTPLPNTIPTDGSTITVWVNGVPLGHPVYNRYRADIAALFPDYNNSDGAVGYYFLDTTRYKNGMHTIQWTVTDDAGNRDGIGSRYFTVQNPAVDKAAAFNIQPARFKVDLSQIPVDVSGPILLKRGYNQHTDPQTIYPDEKDTITIEIEELERIEIRLTLENTSSCRYTGYLAAGSGLKALPIGSTFDTVRGVFSWQPGPGFIKSYRLVFIEETADGYAARISIFITITPKSSGRKYGMN